MQTQLADFIRDSRLGREADSILRSCVHCGFCTATCPTYQLLGDELDGPRGRIYLIKGVLEGHRAGAQVRNHLDRCLTCRACETTCPSGVQYGRLLDIGRLLVERQSRRPLLQRLQRQALLKLMPYPRRFGPLLKLGQWFKPLLPAGLAQKIPASRKATGWPTARHARRMLVLDGCVQPATAPDINHAAARLLELLGPKSKGGPVKNVFDALPDSINTPELHVHMAEGEHHAFMQEFVQKAHFEDAKVITIDGLRAEFADGWGLVRASNTTPVLVLRFEADSKQALQRVQDAFRDQMLAVNDKLELPF